MATRRPPRRAAPKPPPPPTDPRSIRALLPQHFEWLRIHNYSEATIRVRSFELRRFIAWCEARSVVQMVDVTKAVLEDYKRNLYLCRKADGRGLSRTTQVHHLVSVLGMTKWAVKRGLLQVDPASLFELPRTERVLPHPALTSTEVEQVLGAIDVTQPLGIRDRALLEMAYSTGMRRGELARVKLSDVDAERGTVLVRQGKGRKDRMVPIGARALAWLDKYVEDVRVFHAIDVDEGEIFLTQHGTPLKIETLSDMGTKLRRRAGLTKPGAMHIYRHSAATGMLEGGADIRVIQEYLGHANLNSTQVYTKVAILQLKAVHERTHPAERTDPTPARATRKPKR